MHRIPAWFMFVLLGISHLAGAVVLALQGEMTGLWLVLSGTFAILNATTTWISYDETAIRYRNMIRVKSVASAEVDDVRLITRFTTIRVVVDTRDGTRHRPAALHWGRSSRIERRFTEIADRIRRLAG